MTSIKPKWRFFGKKDPLRANFHKCFPKAHIAHGNTCFCANFVKFGRPEVGEIERCLMDNNKKIRLALPLPLLHGSRPKFVKDSPNNVLAVPQISSKSERVNMFKRATKCLQYSAKLQLLCRVIKYTSHSKRCSFTAELVIFRGLKVSQGKVSTINR